MKNKGLFRQLPIIFFLLIIVICVGYADNQRKDFTVTNCNQDKIFKVSKYDNEHNETEQKKSTFQNNFSELDSLVLYIVDMDGTINNKHLIFVSIGFLFFLILFFKSLNPEEQLPEGLFSLSFIFLIGIAAFSSYYFNKNLVNKISSEQKFICKTSKIIEKEYNNFREYKKYPLNKILDENKTIGNKLYFITLGNKEIKIILKNEEILDICNNYKETNKLSFGDVIITDNKLYIKNSALSEISKERLSIILRNCILQAKKSYKEFKEKQNKEKKIEKLNKTSWEVE